MHGERGEQEAEYLLGDQHPAGVQMVADVHGPAEHRDVEREYHDEHPDDDGDHRDGAGFC